MSKYELIFSVNPAVISKVVKDISGEDSRLYVVSRKETPSKVLLKSYSGVFNSEAIFQTDVSNDAEFSIIEPSLFEKVVSSFDDEKIYFFLSDGDFKTLIITNEEKDMIVEIGVSDYDVSEEEGEPDKEMYDLGKIESRTVFRVPITDSQSKKIEKVLKSVKTELIDIDINKSDRSIVIKRGDETFNVSVKLGTIQENEMERLLQESQFVREVEENTVRISFHKSLIDVIKSTRNYLSSELRLLDSGALFVRCQSDVVDVRFGFFPME